MLGRILKASVKTRPDRGGLHRKGTMPRVLSSAVYVFIPYVVYNIPVSFQQMELATLRGSLGENESVEPVPDRRYPARA